MNISKEAFFIRIGTDIKLFFKMWKKGTFLENKNKKNITFESSIICSNIGVAVVMNNFSSSIMMLLGVFYALLRYFLL